MDKYFVQKEVDCNGCDGKGETYHVRACAEDDSTGWYKCYHCAGTGKIHKMIPCDIPDKIAQLLHTMPTSSKRVEEIRNEILKIVED